MQSSECDKRIESFASPPYFITLLNFKCECILHWSTLKSWYNETLDNEVLRMTNDFLYPSNSKIDEKEPRYNEPRSSQQILPVPWPFVRSRFHCTNWRHSFCFLLETGPTVLCLWSNPRQRQYLHCLVVLSISTVAVIKPATYYSTVKRSTDFPWNMSIIGLKYTVQYSTLVET